MHIFLTRLDSDFKQVCGEILRSKVVSNLEACYALIRKDTFRQTNLKAEDVIFDFTYLMTRK